MPSTTFTGRTRQRRTRRLVRVVDFLARWIISIGGIGAIVAVLMVCVFLVWTAYPLALAPTITAQTLARPPAARDDLALRLDLSQRLLAVLSRDGHVRLVETSSGLEIDAQSLGGPLTACSWSPGSTQAAVARADGAVLVAHVAFEQSTADVHPLADGETSRLADGRYYQRLPGGDVQATRLALALDDPLRAAGGDAVRALDFVATRSGPLLALVTESGAAEVIRVRQRRALRDSRARSETTRIELPLPSEAAGAPRFLRVSGLGDNVYAAWDDGRLARFAINAEGATLVEELDLVERPTVRLTALEFLVGRTTLVAGDSAGGLRAWFPVPRQVDGVQQTRLTAVHELPAAQAAVTALAPSAEKRLIAAGFADARVRLFHVTSARQLAEVKAEGPPRLMAFAPAIDGLVVETPGRLARYALDVRHPEVTLASLFRPVWYESYAAPQHVWQSSGGVDYEPKLGFMPLVFGTAKATLFSLLFAIPLALLGAVYSSEFLHPSTRSRVKPVVEMMASLPSVVLGFLAALVLAPFVERFVPVLLAALYTLPLTLVAGAYCWQMLPQRFTLRLARWRFVSSAAALPLGLALAIGLGPPLERWLFAGDIKLWLDGQVGRAWGGWFWLLMAPLSMAAALATSSWINPGLRRLGAGWTYGGFAVVNTAKFVAVALATLAAALAAAWFLEAAGLDPRGSLVGTYVQRNALIVGFAMGFAVIPIIYTLAEDALSSVPDHLRSASLGAGATPWQTAVRVVIPTAMSGIFSAVMVGLGRAVGETMIVLMAAGNTPIMEWNPFNGMRTLSAAIATELPEAAQGTTEFRVLFLAALVLFAMTFALNTLAEIVRQRFRRRAGAL